MDDYALLVLLSESDGHSARMSELADDAIVPRPQVTYRISRLEKRGHRRAPARASRDARGTEAHLTDEGFALLERAAPPPRHQRPRAVPRPPRRRGVLHPRRGHGTGPPPPRRPRRPPRLRALGARGRWPRTRTGHTLLVAACATPAHVRAHSLPPCKEPRARTRSAWPRLIALLVGSLVSPAAALTELDGAREDRAQLEDACWTPRATSRRSRSRSTRIQRGDRAARRTRRRAARRTGRRRRLAGGPRPRCVHARRRGRAGGRSWPATARARPPSAPPCWSHWPCATAARWRRPRPCAPGWSRTVACARVAWSELAELEAEMERRVSELNDRLEEAKDRERFLELKARRQREVADGVRQRDLQLPGRRPRLLPRHLG